MTTEAGQRLLAAVRGEHAVAPDGIPYVDHISAIESEARVGHAECEANMDAEIGRLAAALTEADGFIRYHIPRSVRRDEVLTRIAAALAQ